MGKTKNKKLTNAHYIRTKKFRKDYFCAFVTWNGLDLSETGETEKRAAYFLLIRHLKHLGITEDEIPALMAQIGFYKPF